MHPSRLFDSLFLIYIYILQNTSQKMYEAKEKKKYAVDTEKKQRGLNSKLFKQVITK